MALCGITFSSAPNWSPKSQLKSCQSCHVMSVNPRSVAERALPKKLLLYRANTTNQSTTIRCTLPPRLSALGTGRGAIHVLFVYVGKVLDSKGGSHTFDVPPESCVTESEHMCLDGPARTNTNECMHTYVSSNDIYVCTCI